MRLLSFGLVIWATLAMLMTGCSDNPQSVSGLPAVGSRLYVVQTNDESLGEINLETGEVSPRVQALGLYSNDIVKHGNRLYVANSGTNSIQEIDAESNQTLRAIPVGDGTNPWTAAFLNDDTMAVSCLGTRSVALIRLTDGVVIGQWPVASSPEGLVVYQGLAYVCDTGVSYPDFSAGSVLVYDAASWQRLDSVAVGVNAQFAAVDSLGRLHVVCTGNYADVAGTIYVINLSTRIVDQILPIGGAPNTVSFGGGYAFVAAGGFGGTGKVFRYRLADLAVLNDDTNPLETGSGVIDVEAMENGSFYATCFDEDEVRHHRADGALIHTYLVSDGPAYLVAYP